jgi:hypothetical protein
VFDSRCAEIYLIGQNLRTLLSSPTALEQLKGVVEDNPAVVLTILLATPLQMMMAGAKGVRRHGLASR